MPVLLTAGAIDVGAPPMPLLLEAGAVTTAGAVDGQVRCRCGRSVLMSVLSSITGAVDGHVRTGPFGSTIGGQVPRQYRSTMF